MFMFAQICIIYIFIIVISIQMAKIQNKSQLNVQHSYHKEIFYLL